MIGHNNPLKQLIERIERLVDEKQGLQEGIRDVYAEVNSKGYDVKVVKAVIKRRSETPEKIKEFEDLLDAYEHQLTQGELSLDK